MTNSMSLYQAGPWAHISHDVLIKEMWEILNPKFNHVFPTTFTIDSAFHRLPSQSLSGYQDVFFRLFFVSTGLSFSSSLMVVIFVPYLLYCGTVNYDPNCGKWHLQLFKSS